MKLVVAPNRQSTNTCPRNASKMCKRNWHSITIIPTYHFYTKPLPKRIPLLSFSSFTREKCHSKINKYYLYFPLVMMMISSFLSCIPPTAASIITKNICLPIILNTSLCMHATIIWSVALHRGHSHESYHFKYSWNFGKRAKKKFK